MSLIHFRRKDVLLFSICALTLLVWLQLNHVSELPLRTSTKVGSGSDPTQSSWGRGKEPLVTSEDEEKGAANPTLGVSYFRTLQPPSDN